MKVCRSYRVKTFDGLPERLSGMRQYLHRILGEVDGVDEVVLVASELAGNAIRHSRSGEPGGSFTLQVVDLSNAWHVRVEDQGSSDSPNPRSADEIDEAGRGLPVVAALSRAWGVIGDSAGRTVWAEIPYPKDDIEAAFYGDDVEADREELAFAILPGHPANDFQSAPWAFGDVDPVAVVSGGTQKSPTIAHG